MHLTKAVTNTSKHPFNNTKFSPRITALTFGTKMATNNKIMRRVDNIFRYVETGTSFKIRFCSDNQMHNIVPKVIQCQENMALYVQQ